jgi:hypothetical protein
VVPAVAVQTTVDWKPGQASSLQASEVPSAGQVDSG